MKYAIKGGSIEKLSCDCLIIPIWSKGALSNEAKSLDVATGKAISKLMKSGDFAGKLAQTSLLYDPEGVAAKRILLIGAGERKKFHAHSCAKALKGAAKAVSKLQAARVHFALSDTLPTDRDGVWLATRVAQEMEDACYKYDTTKSKKAKAVAIRAVSISIPGKTTRKQVDAGLATGAAIGKAINRAKQLGNLPGNVCTPTFLANEAQTLATRHKSLSTKVLTEKQMARLGMGSLLSVGAGSDQESKLIIIEHKGAKADSKPYVLVGKGITFDTGGISLKPGSAMDEMKFDMCGAASVVATMGCVAELNLPINVIGMVAAAENMPSGRATKPGDIVTSMSGKTIEILNTDAEGRLVLCDALTYAERFKPRTIIDIATLTGAAVATFGAHANVLLSNNDQLAETLLDCGEESLDRAWQLPLWDEYQSLLNSNFADIANIGGPRAGTITAACFLSRFTEKQKWAHLDIAGSAWHSGAQKGATGRPVGLLMQYLNTQKP
ncbi:MAG: leucyl aminopeptidase [Pseudomonadales bacterium]|nr:leucyl aminopeptidase [Pseudomonadales bacterium]